MPQQLIYTSAPRGIVAGRSGYCTVARSVAMREPLILQLEKLSYYQHLSLSGGQERPIHCCRVVDIRGSRYHVLSRIQDAGLDFTGRTNFVAHHLVFTPEEVRQFPSPPVILRGWTGWVKAWSKEPQLLENEDWSGLAGLLGSVFVPATNWLQVTGDAINGFGLFESRAGIAFRVDNLTEEQVLVLFAESLELLELRDPRRDFHATAWEYTFTTSMQEQDNPADFRWRCLHSDNPAASRSTPPDCRELSAVRANRCKDEETAFARTGRQPPRFVKLASDKSDIQEGTPVRLEVATDGVPYPKIKWFEDGNKVPDATGTTLELTPSGRAKRYQVEVENSEGKAESNVVEISIRPIVRLQRPAETQPYQPKNAKGWEESETTTSDSNKYISAWWLIGLFIAVVVVGGGGLWIRQQRLLKAEPSLKDGTKQGAVPTAPPVVDGSRPQTEAKRDKSEQTQNAASSTSLEQSAEDRLPEGWTPIVIGTVTNSSARYIADAKPAPRFDLTASAEGFRTYGDSLFFVCTNAGVKFKTTLLILTNDPPLPANGIRGIMIRHSTNQTSPFLFIGASSQKVFAYLREANNNHQLNYTSARIKSVPITLTIEQKGERFEVSYRFVNSSKEEEVFPGYVIRTNAQLLLGFAICSGDSSTNVTAHFNTPRGN